MKYALLFLLLPASCRGRDAMVVMAASSLCELADDVAREWSRRTGIAVRVQTGSSSLLARQIREGASGDLFLSADAEWIDSVAPAARRDWIGNRLVLVVRRDAPDGEPASLSLGGEGVPIGRYARIAMERSGMRLPARIVYGSNARDV